MNKTTERVLRQLAPPETDSIQLEGIVYGLEHPKQMAKYVFEALQSREEQMELTAALGQDCAVGFDEDRKEVNRLLEAAPWTLHPDYGCVLTAQITELERAAARLHPREPVDVRTDTDCAGGIQGFEMELLKGDGLIGAGDALALYDLPETVQEAFAAGWNRHVALSALQRDQVLVSPRSLEAESDALDRPRSR